ncbi:hypothetical protein QVD99_004137 [Batrachochytrium dendrobatidis]|nr:hypothetical protein O5D80_005616 [Batrachochytrium dendrobatidis]KAK5669753.1 hypothetical protein QVD99_004137 [Batrachochytrium dendrobatidis]
MGRAGARRSGIQQPLSSSSRPSSTQEATSAVGSSAGSNGLRSNLGSSTHHSAKSLTKKQGTSTRIQQQLLKTFTQRKVLQAADELKKSLKDTQQTVKSAVKEERPNTCFQADVEMDSDVVEMLKDRPALIKAFHSFDLSAMLGPCVGLSRFERWSRAKNLGLNPDEQLGKLLATHIAQVDPILGECLWFDKL